MGLRLWVSVVCCIALAQNLGSKCCVREEREALLNIKAKLQTSYDDPLPSWLADPNSDCCTWNRVTCHPSSGRVTMISLQNLKIMPSPFLSVPIDFSFFRNFKQLTTLNFTQQTNDFFAPQSNFQFGGLINTQALANLSNLEVLILKHNYLQGPVPIKDLCGLKKIRVLDFSRNNFEGSLPKCLANLTSLQALDLSDNFLTGEIPVSAIASFMSLEYLSLMYNNFEGSFPLKSFANNSQLKVLALQMNSNNFQVDTEGDLPWVPLFQLEVLHMPKCKVNMGRATFPSFLLYQHDLYYLDLSDNNLSGLFPSWLLVNNTNLRSLILDHNSFTGPFELPLTNTDRLPHPLINLQLSNNKMEGRLPKDIGLIFPNLEYLNVSGNGFDGGIPTSFGNMSNLHILVLSRNRFSGEVPGSLWTGCASLRYLILSQNDLWGQPFSSPLNLSSLQWLFLDNNYLNGTLEHGEWHLPRLEVLDISNNNLWGIVPGSIGDLSSLEVINLSGNNFTGTLPREFCTLDLLHLHLSHNKLSGSIPACYLNLKNLLSLHLQRNSLVGSIPTLRKTTSFLSTLDLRDNNLSGGIPNWIAKVELLRALLLGGNHLQGQIPDQLCQLNEISFLDLSRNNFTGNIPSCFYNVSFGRRHYRISEYEMTLGLSDSWYWYNHLHLLLFFDQNLYFMTAIAGGVEVEFRTKDSFLPYKGDILRFMSGIDLSCNQLIGEIPHESGYLSSLRALNLSHNHLHGSIPTSFRNLTDIESLDLSYNNLSGQIPLQLQELISLAVFNVSYNNLSGTVPSSKQFGAFDDSSFIGNPYLLRNNSNRGTTTPILPPQPTPSSNEKEDESVIDFTSFIWSFAASYVTVLLILVTVLWINPYWRRLWFYHIETCLYRCLYPYLKDAFY